MRKTKIKISTILEIHNTRKEINSLDLHDIEFLDENDKPLIIDEKLIEDFRFCGLSNTDFILTGFYKGGWDK